MKLPTNYSLTNYMYNHLTVFKQMTNIKLNRYCYIDIIGTIQQCANN